MNIRHLTFVVLLLLLSSAIFCCSDKQDKATYIINQAIQASGGEKYQDFSVKFKFRDIHYIADRKKGLFSYERIIDRNDQQIHDILNNEGLVRLINDEQTVLVDSMREKYSNSVNSVLYFALLPFGLNDPAVNKKYLGERELMGTDYYKIEISFDQQGGGKDYQDIFIYWINKKSYFVDYLAYTYETDGGGSRFRKAKNPRTIGGIRFQDYTNYVPLPHVEGVPLHLYDSLFEVGNLEVLSEIELLNIKSLR